MQERPDSLPVDSAAALGSAVRDVLRARFFVFRCHHNLQEQAYRQWDYMLVRLSDTEFKQYLDHVHGMGLCDMRREPLSERANLEKDRARLYETWKSFAPVVPERNPGEKPRG